MNARTLHGRIGATYELRFRSLFNPGRGYCFPCDAGGHVDLDALSASQRDSYFYARTSVGREFASPAVQRSDVC